MELIEGKNFSISENPERHHPERCDFAFKPALGLEGKVLANGPGDLGSIPGCIIPKTLKMVLDTPLLNTQQYKVCIKGKVEKSKERSSALSYISV